MTDWTKATDEEKIMTNQNTEDAIDSAADQLIITSQEAENAKQKLRLEQIVEKLTELVESAISDFTKLKPFIGGAADATAKLYQEGLAKCLHI